MLFNKKMLEKTPLTSVYALFKQFGSSPQAKFDYGTLLKPLLLYLKQTAVNVFLMLQNRTI